MISKYITENGKFRQIDEFMPGTWINLTAPTQDESCLLYTSDAADEEDSVDLGGRRIIKKNKKERKEDEEEGNKKKKE